MFEQVIVPLDGSRMAQCALPAAVSIATTYNSEIELLHVLSESQSDVSTQVDPLQWHMRKAESESYLSTIAHTLAQHDLTTRRTILEGAAAERIVAHAAAQDVDLLVMSSHGHTGISGWNVSSVAQKIIARANRSILLVRAFQQPPTTRQEIEPLNFRRLLVPLDGSRRAECILPVANKLATAFGATVWLVHVATPANLVSPFAPRGEEAPSPDDVAQQYTHAADAYLQHLQAQLDCASKTAVLQGDTILSTLNHFAARETVDLMLICAHGQANTRQPYGSFVTSAIIHGDVSLFILQDLLPTEIEPTRAEIAASQLTNGNPIRTNQHAQPAFWTH